MDSYIAFISFTLKGKYVTDFIDFIAKIFFKNDVILNCFMSEGSSMCANLNDRKQCRLNKINELRIVLHFQ